MRRHTVHAFDVKAAVLSAQPDARLGSRILKKKLAELHDKSRFCAMTLNSDLFDRF